MNNHQCCGCKHWDMYGSNPFITGDGDRDCADAPEGYGLCTVNPPIMIPLLRHMPRDPANAYIGLWPFTHETEHCGAFVADDQ